MINLVDANQNKTGKVYKNLQVYATEQNPCLIDSPQPFYAVAFDLRYQRKSYPKLSNV